MQAEVSCPLCKYWGDVIEASEARIEQASHGALWEHLQAAHYQQCKDMRKMRHDERRAALAPFVAYRVESPGD